MLKYHLARAQQQMKAQADKHRSDRVLAIGDWVFVNLDPYRQHVIANRTNQKLVTKFFGPSEVLSKVGVVA